jgi:hypothetical protein
MNDWQGIPSSPNCVTIFGAGIAGLTAAHEFVERGFQVQIWEPALDQRFPDRGPDIGGLARTQWSSVPWPDKRNADQFEPLNGVARISAGAQASPIVHFPEKFAFIRDQETSESLRLERRGTGRAESLSDDLFAFLSDVGDIPLLLLGRGLDAADPIARERRVHQLCSGLHEAIEQHFDSAIGRSRGVRVSWAARGPREWIIDVSLEVPGRAALKVEVQLVADSLVESAADGRRSSANTQGVLYGRQRYEDGAVSGTRIKANTYWELVSPWVPGRLHVLGRRGIEAMEEPDGPNEALKRVIGEMLQVLRENPHVDYLYVEASHLEFKGLNQAERAQRAEVIAARCRALLPSDVTLTERSLVPPKYLLDLPGRTITLEIVLLGAFPSGAPKDAHVLGGFRVRERWLPGEHGYRLFPSSYRHLFDTMKRTPILDVQPKSEFSQEQERLAGVRDPEKSRYVETGRTVYDNLHPTSRHLLAFSSGQRPAVLSRYRVQSLEELRQYLNIIFAPRSEGGFDLQVADGLRFNLKVLQYVTSCSKRRQQYESMSWWEYLGADSYAKEFGNFVERWPEALVAMDAKVADARSQGNSLIQISLDQIRPQGFRDGTLRGPTSEAWLRHWRSYLEAQGVRFLHGKLTGFRVETVEASKRVFPTVECYEPHYPTMNGYPELMPGYFVLATSADQAKVLAERYLEAVGHHPDLQAPEHLSDLVCASKFDVGGLPHARPTGEFRHFAGIQFYFAEDVLWVDGHVYYPDSPWGLSSVSQARFWDERTDWEHGFRGILSVIIATWDVPGHLTGKCAWQCAPEEIANEVWHQIRTSVERDRLRNLGGPVARNGSCGAGYQCERPRQETRFRLEPGLVEERLPTPLYWHLDDAFHWLGNGYENQTPFHIASPQSWPRRPGDPDRGYTVENGFVMCGMHTKTRWRLPSMEAANESARHAVNAVLVHADQTAGAELRRSLCDVWDPEQEEIADLQWFKDLDRKLYERGLPHVVEILDLERLTELVIRESQGVDVLDARQILNVLTRLVPGILQDRGVHGV